MYVDGDRHFYVLEFARLGNGNLVVPVRWLTQKGKVKADAFEVKYLPGGTASINTSKHWGQGPLETCGNMSGTWKGENTFTCHVTTNPRSGTFHMYFQIFLILSLTNNQSSHFHPSLNVPTMYPHIPCELHLFL